ALVLGVFVFLNNRKETINKVFFLLTILFCSWIYFDLILWASEKPELIMFFWSALILIEYFIFITALWLTHLFLFKRNFSKIFFGIFVALFLPILILGHTEFNLIAFDASNCDRGVFEGALWIYLYI